MIWLKYTLAVIGIIYLMTAVLVAAFVIIFGAPWWMGLKVGFLMPFVWLRLI